MSLEQIIQSSALFQKVSEGGYCNSREFGVQLKIGVRGVQITDVPEIRNMHLVKTPLPWKTDFDNLKFFGIKLGFRQNDRHGEEPAHAINPVEHSLVCPYLNDSFSG